MPYRSDFFKAKLVAGDYDRKYGADRFANRFKTFFTDGVIIPRGGIISNELKVSTVPGTMKTKVEVGSALIQGYGVEVYSEPVELTHTVGDPLYDRIDRVVLELNLTDEVRAVEIKTLSGLAAVVPSAPELTRSNTVYQLSLANIRIPAAVTTLNTAVLTDERQNSSLCGIANVAIGVTSGEYVLQENFDAHVNASAPHTGHETPAGAQAKVDAHAALTNPHGATAAATASRIMMRDASGRAKVASPSAADDIARKDTVDAVQGNLTAHVGDSTAHITAGERTTWNGKLNASAVGNASGNVPISNGSVNTNLNADLLDGKHANEIRRGFQNLYVGFSSSYAAVNAIFKGMTDAFEFYYYYSGTSMRKVNVVTGVVTDLGAWPLGTLSSYLTNIEMAYVCPNGRVFVSFSNDNSLSPNYQRNLYTYYSGTWTLIAQMSPGSASGGGYGFGMEIDNNTFLVVGWVNSTSVPYYKINITTGAAISSGNVGNGDVTATLYAGQSYWGGTGYYIPSSMSLIKDGDYVLPPVSNVAIKLSNMLMYTSSGKFPDITTFNSSMSSPYRFGYGANPGATCSYRCLMSSNGGNGISVFNFVDGNRVDVVPPPSFSVVFVGVPTDISAVYIANPVNSFKYNLKY